MQTAEWYDYDPEDPSESSGWFMTWAGIVLAQLDQYRDEQWEDPGQ